jgi:hypothetical protein
MEFNTRTRSVVRGAGQGVPVNQNSAVVVDHRGLVFAVESGPCGGSSGLGRVRAFRPDLTEIRGYLLGPCAVAIAVALVPVLGNPRLQRCVKLPQDSTPGTL